MDLKVQEYWNNVERATESTRFKIKDNYSKRRVLVEALLKYPLVGARIVELGSGAGVTPYAISLINGRISYTGIDISEKYATLAREAFGLTIKVGDMTDGLPFKDNSCDCIFAFDSLEHIHSSDRPKLFREMDRILEDDDRMIFINNPMNRSRHDPAFDFELDEMDVALLCSATKTRILEVKLLQIVEGYTYQFIVLGSLSNEDTTDNS